MKTRATLPRLLAAIAWCLMAAHVAVPALATVPGADSDAGCLALALYWEAREEGREGMLAVGWVVLNRRRAAKFPATICEVVKQGGDTPPCQFSYWCDGRRDEPKEEESWAAARKLAAELLSSPPPDPTHGAVFFHREDVRPDWSAEQRKTARVGRHTYYR